MISIFHCSTYILDLVLCQSIAIVVKLRLCGKTCWLDEQKQRQTRASYLVYEHVMTGNSVKITHHCFLCVLLIRVRLFRSCFSSFPIYLTTSIYLGNNYTKFINITCFRSAAFNRANYLKTYQVFCWTISTLLRLNNIFEPKTMLIHHRKLLTCLLVAIVGGQYGFLLVTSDYQHLQRDDTEESVYFQAINSYLTDFDSLGVLQQSTVTDRLGNAVEAIESLGKQNFARLDPVRDDAGVKFKTLLDNDPAAVLSIMKSLISASKSCDQESSSFLMLTLNQT